MPTMPNPALTDRKDKHGNIWGYRRPGVSKDAWSPPQKGLEDKTKE